MKSVSVKLTPTQLDVVLSALFNRERTVENMIRIFEEEGRDRTVNAYKKELSEVYELQKMIQKKQLAL